jgi:hypothetical protein
MFSKFVFAKVSISKIGGTKKTMVQMWPKFPEFFDKRLMKIFPPKKRELIRA